MRASPPGLNGAIFWRSKRITLGVSVSPGPTLCVKPGPAHTPVKSGLPEASRGIAVRCCAETGNEDTRRNRHAVNTIEHALISDLHSLLGNGVFRSGREHFFPIFGEQHSTTGGVEGSVLSAES